LADEALDLISLAEENLRRSRENDDLRRLIERPVEVSVDIRGQDHAAWQKFMDYMPHLTMVSSNLAEVAGAMKNPATPTNAALTGISNSLVGINNHLARIADALERAHP
jgi:hypothetical protein